MRFFSNKYLELFSKYLKCQWKKVVLLTLILMINIVLQLVNPQIIRFFIDSTASGKPYELLIQISILFFILTIFQQILAIATTYIGKNIAWVATNALREDLVSHCLKLDMTFYKSHKIGELIDRIDGDANSLLNFFSKLVAIVISNLLLVLGVLVLLFKESYLMGIAQTIFVLITIIVFSKTQSSAIPHWVATRKISAEFYGFIGESINSTEDIKSNGCSSYIMKRFYKFMQKWLPKRKKAYVMGYRMYMIILALSAVSNVLALGVGTYLWNKGMITIGTIYLFYNYSRDLIKPIDQIQNQLQDLQNAMASIERIQELFNRTSKIIDNGKEVSANNSFELSVNNICFEYEKDIPVLKNISFSLSKGKKIGIIGRTGSGKTTLARLLMRFYDPISGTILLGNQDIKSIKLSDLRNKIAYVTQDVQLLQGTIRDNLTFFNKNISDETLLNIIKNIGIESWYKSLPNGLDTIVSSSGGLSAGESQLIAFIRVFLKNPSLVILDEASSKIDPITENLIQKSILNLFDNRAGIVIAHKLWTLKYVDEIMIIDKGKILEYGNRKELENNPDSYFSKLLKIGIQEVLV